MTNHLYTMEAALSDSDPFVVMDGMTIVDNILLASSPVGSIGPYSSQSTHIYQLVMFVI